MGMIKEFKEFAVRGNMIDMAVGIIIGGAFGKIVSSLVQDVIMPPIGILLGGVDFSALSITLKEASAGAEAVTLNYGRFAQTSVDFFIVAFAMFIIVKAINALKRKQEAAPENTTQPSQEVVLLTQIRDAIKTSKTLVLAFLMSSVFLCSYSSYAQDEEAGCKSMLLVEPVSGEVIYENNADEQLSPASVVKLMTAYVVFKKLKENLISLDEKVTVSAFASNIGGSQVYLRENEEFTLGQLLEAMQVQSANDAATAIAEHIAGSSEAFVQMMNEEAQSLGMKNSEFHSPHGLPPGKDQKPDLITARDIILLSRVLLRDFPEVLENSSKTTVPFRDGTFTMSSPNHLLRTFPGADGLKTGYYALAGFSVVATAKRNDVRMLAAVLGCKRRQERDKEAAKLLAQGLAQYKVVPLIAKGEEIEGTIPVANGTKQTTIALAKEDFKALVNSKEIGKIKKVPNLCAGLDAPFNAGAPCGTLSFVVGEREIGQVPLVVADSVEALSFGRKVARYIGIE